MGPAYDATDVAPLDGLRIRGLADNRLVEKIRLIDSACLPVKYGDHYYKTYVYNNFHPFNQIAYYHDILVGSITCRLEPSDVEGVYVLYIMTLCVLEPYRSMGIGSRLIDTILRNVYRETQHCIRAITLHVQVGSPALRFYTKFHFDVVKEIKDYYEELEQRNALLLRREIPQPFLTEKKGTTVTKL